MARLYCVSVSEVYSFSKEKVFSRKVSTNAQYAIKANNLILNCVIEMAMRIRATSKCFLRIDGKQPKLKFSQRQLIQWHLFVVYISVFLTLSLFPSRCYDFALDELPSTKWIQTNVTERCELYTIQMHFRWKTLQTFDRTLNTSGVFFVSNETQQINEKNEQSLNWGFFRIKLLLIENFLRIQKALFLPIFNGSCVLFGCSILLKKN